MSRVGSVERQHDRGVDAQAVEEQQAVRERDEGLRRRAREDGPRVGVERQHHRLAPLAVGERAQLLEHVAVAAVHAVEDADRHDGAPERGPRERLEPVDPPHRQTSFFGG